MKKDKLKKYTKTIATVATGYGVAELMGSILKDFRPDAKGIRKLAIKIGAAALTGLVIKAAADFVSDEVDDIFDTVDQTIEEAKIAIEEEIANET